MRVAFLERFPGYLAYALALVIVGCAQLGLAPAQSFDQKLAYAYGTHTAVLQATASAVTAGTLTAAEGQSVQTLGAQSRELLDAARAVESTDTNAANAKLVLATAVLTQLQTYLQSRGVK